MVRPPTTPGRRIGAGLTGSVLAVSSAVAVVALGTGTAEASNVALQHTVVVSHLNNPRQLDFVRGGLLIAEAGRGGKAATVTSPDGAKQGFGYTGSVSLVLGPSRASNERPHRILQGLPSAGAAAGGSDPVGSGAVGSDGVAARDLGDIAVQETYFGPKITGRRVGKLLLGKGADGTVPVADITGFEKAHDPDGYGVDSDPYAVVNYKGGWLVADAAANDILRVTRAGAISVFHVFKNVTKGACAGQEDPKSFKGCNFVPTSIATDSKGNVYVGGLSGFAPNLARVVKLNSAGRHVKTWGGFNAVTGLAVGRNGALYVSEFAGAEKNAPAPGISGLLTRVQNGKRTSTDVPFPGGVAVDVHNNVYVSAWSIAPAAGMGFPGTSGQVWRLHF